MEVDVFPSPTSSQLSRNDIPHSCFHELHPSHLGGFPICQARLVCLAELFREFSIVECKGIKVLLGGSFLKFRTSFEVGKC